MPVTSLTTLLLDLVSNRHSTALLPCWTSQDRCGAGIWSTHRPPCSGGLARRIRFRVLGVRIRRTRGYWCCRSGAASTLCGHRVLPWRVIFLRAV
ncbi:hypothetical protein C8F04DRAFT_1080301 [Mycena alexandri]|uniref:Uncharacterized protein n=1 Tax=Mycena alexandri TaxID=1745969 RepID=A0AAD6TBX7_9AGAR|nr:hypothetical protein C8F04DRAFT_1080301 [Mycena alexandri]